MSFIKINTETLKNEAEEITELTDSVLKMLDKMFEGVSSLDSMWEGPANESFNAQFRSDYTRFCEVCKNVKSLASDMKKAAKEYSNCENIIESEIRRLNF